MNKLYTVLCFASLFILANQSCTKIDTTTLGSELIPEVDNVNTFDTTLEVISNLEVLADTTKIFSSAADAEDHALGLITNDPSFGSTKGDIYFAIGTNSSSPISPFPVKDSIRGVDSVVLQLAYTGQYGDSTSIEQFQVSEISPTVEFDIPWNDTKTFLRGYRIDTLNSSNGNGFQTVRTLSGIHTQDFTKLDDGQVVDTTRVPNVMRIKLDNSFGTRLVNYDTVGPTAAYRSDSLFRRAVRGLAIQTKGSSSALGGAIAYFNLNSANTQVIVYYKYGAVGGGGKDSAAKFGFALSTTVSANLVERKNGGTPYASVLANANPNDPELYIQSAPGSMARISIPGLAGMPNIVVHRAELSTARLPGQNDQAFTEPALLFLDAIDVANSRVQTIPADWQYDATGSSGFLYNLNYFGGFLQNNRYFFNLSRYVQGIVSKKNTSYTLRLYSPYRTRPYVSSLANYIELPLSSRIAYGRVLVAGGSYPDAARKMKLRIIYSKI